MKVSIKIFILLLLVIVSVFLIQNLVVFLKNSQLAPEGGENEEIQQGISVSLKIDSGEGSVKTFNGIELKEEKTAFALLKKAAQENNLELSFKEYPGTGIFIESIDNIGGDATNNKWWQYWVNGEYATIGAGDFQLKNGDSVEWKYINSQF